MGLLPDGAVVQGGSIEYLGQDLLQKTPAEMRAIRGKEIAMIFQEPMTSLNPVHTIGFQIGEMLKIHYPELSKEEVEKRVIAQLEAVGISNAKERIKQYPHQFSGGMRQRVMIAMAIICKPQAFDRGRTDHCAGRDHPGAGIGSDAQAQARRRPDDGHA